MRVAWPAPENGLNACIFRRLYLSSAHIPKASGSIIAGAILSLGQTENSRQSRIFTNDVMETGL
jgi:hypothetical protein